MHAMGSPRMISFFPVLGALMSRDKYLIVGARIPLTRAMRVLDAHKCTYTWVMDFTSGILRLLVSIYAACTFSKVPHPHNGTIRTVRAYSNLPNTHDAIGIRQLTGRVRTHTSLRNVFVLVVSPAISTLASTTMSCARWAAKSGFLIAASSLSFSTNSRLPMCNTDASSVVMLSTCVGSNPTVLSACANTCHMSVRQANRAKPHKWCHIKCPKLCPIV